MHVICCFAAPNHGVLFPGLFDFNSHTFAWSLVCTGETPSSVLVSASCKNIYSVTGFVFGFRVSVVLFGFIACFPFRFSGVSAFWFGFTACIGSIRLVFRFSGVYLVLEAGFVFAFRGPLCFRLVFMFSVLCFRLVFMFSVLCFRLGFMFSGAYLYMQR